MFGGLTLVLPPERMGVVRGLLFSLFIFQFCYAAESVAPPAAEAPKPAVPAESAPTEAAPSTTDGEYEIDYEEEPGGDAADEEAPEPIKTKTGKSGSKKGAGGPAVQGSRAKHRFEPILKSETKSIYKKDGKPLDVDTD